MILLTHQVGSSKLPMFPPPQCGSSNPTHALIIYPEKIGREQASNYGFAPCSQHLITELFENRMNPTLLLLLLLISVFVFSFFLFLITVPCDFEFFFQFDVDVTGSVIQPAFWFFLSVTMELYWKVMFHHFLADCIMLLGQCLLYHHNTILFTQTMDDSLHWFQICALKFTP